MKIFFLILIFLIGAVVIIRSQETERTERRLSAEISIGANFNTTHQVSLPGLSYQNTTAAFSGTFFYESEFLIKIGIESGYFPVTGINNQSVTNEFGTTTVNSQLSAIPLLLVFSMNYENLYLQYGRGAFFMVSIVDAFGTKSRSSETVAGFNLGLLYKYPLNNNWKIGAAAKFYYISDAGNSLIFLGAVINYNLMSY